MKRSFPSENAAKDPITREKIVVSPATMVLLNTPRSTWSSANIPRKLSPLNSTSRVDGLRGTNVAGVICSCGSDLSAELSIQ